MRSDFKLLVYLLAALFAGVLAVGCATTPALDGQSLFATNCASCHGPYGEGDGHVVSIINVQPQDLRQIAQRNGGLFPREAVIELVDGRSQRKAHDFPGMPVWGEQFAHGSGDKEANDAQILGTISAIVDYLETTQH